MLEKLWGRTGSSRCFAGQPWGERGCWVPAGHHPGHRLGRLGARTGHHPVLPLVPTPTCPSRHSPTACTIAAGRVVRTRVRLAGEEVPSPSPVCSLVSSQNAGMGHPWPAGSWRVPATQRHPLQGGKALAMMQCPATPRSPMAPGPPLQGAQAEHRGAAPRPLLTPGLPTPLGPQSITP